MKKRFVLAFALLLVIGCGGDGTDVVDPPAAGPDTIAPGDTSPIPAVPDDSCVGRCGTSAPSGCGCDNACFERGDCCSDKAPVCGEYKPPAPPAVKSCKGQCGHDVSGGCSCKEGCEAKGDCCADKTQWCGKPPPPTTKKVGCDGYCGKESPDGCWCNNDCHQAGNCCANKEAECGPFKPPPVAAEESCNGICGQEAPSGCWCNNDCHQAGNCCVDKEPECGPYKPPPAPLDESCENKCGGQADSGCWCNNGCHEKEDCCTDKELFCGPYKPPVPEDQCKGFCGGQSPAGCFCDNDCHTNDNCCGDKVAFCGDYEPPPEPADDSCLGICGAQAPSGCWCNNECHDNDNCCGDKELHCGPYEPPPPEPNASCQGICGAQAESGCWCNAECHEAGNCCDDKVAACGAPPDSCVNRCGEEAPGGCSCVDGCEAEATCCPDKAEACGTPPDLLEGSCDGICGEQSPQGCWCDEKCADLDDCCEDKVEICGEGPVEPEGSCEGICGEQAPEGCWCDDKCEASDDCCPDKAALCGEPPPPPVDSATCKGICGGQAASGCWCDDTCEKNKDCCLDKATECGETTCEKLGHAQGKCSGFLNGSKCADNSPFNCTKLEDYGVKCWVQSGTCAPSEKCQDPLGPSGAKCVADSENPLNSCEGICDGQAPGGCWCDNLCEQSGDCCPDKKDKCGETSCEDLGHALGSCIGIFNGSKCEANQPYECQNVGTIKCWVQTNTCSETEICEDPLGPTGAHCEVDPGNAQNSCKDKCDGQAPSGCWCDKQCEANGDCCPDKEEACGETTCEDLGYLGSCGLFSGSKCEAGHPYACQEKGGLKCWVQTETCGDGQVCKDPFGPSPAACESDPENALNSCKDKCGGQADGGCWCDDQCDQTGDCCPDKKEMCGEPTCEDLGFPQGSCGVFSNTKCADNQPHACEKKGSLSCWVQSETCEEGFKCVDPLVGAAKCEVDDGSPVNSCAGNCGNQAPGGCWCDTKCEDNGDCCADKKEKCGATTCEDQGFPGGACGTFSGDKCQDGNPWDCQNQGALKCWVQTATCTASEKCVDPLTSAAKCEADDTNPSNSCVGNCDKQAPGGCWCDDKCDETGDCCDDKESACGETTCEALGYKLGSCGLFSGSKCEENQPYDCTEKGSLKCWVQLEVCAPGQECVDPFGPTGAHCEGEPTPAGNSCADICDKQAPDGCWCDAQCVENDDCCPDYADLCAG